MIYLHKGTIISCPECKKELYVVAQDIQRGSIAQKEQFESIGEAPVLDFGVPSICYLCETPFVNRDFNWHTMKGWVE